MNKVKQILPVCYVLKKNYTWCFWEVGVVFLGLSNEKMGPVIHNLKGLWATIILADKLVYYFGSCLDGRLKLSKFPFFILAFTTSWQIFLRVKLLLYIHEDELQPV